MVPNFQTHPFVELEHPLGYTTLEPFPAVKDSSAMVQKDRPQNWQVLDICTNIYTSYHAHHIYMSTFGKSWESWEHPTLGSPDPSSRWTWKLGKLLGPFKYLAKMWYLEKLGNKWNSLFFWVILTNANVYVFVCLFICLFPFVQKHLRPVIRVAGWDMPNNNKKMIGETGCLEGLNLSLVFVVRFFGDWRM